MLEIVQSRADLPNPAFQEEPRQDGEDNVAWLKRVRRGKKKHEALLVLFGGVDQTAFRLRVAQSYARHDLTPSHWSDIAWINNPSSLSARSTIVQMSLAPVAGFGFPPVDNGVQNSTLSPYQDPAAYPNVALLRVPVANDKVKAVLERFPAQRHVINGPEHLVAWLAYLWGVDQAGNPLRREVGVPSAILLEYAFAAAGFDLSPGLASRSSCPEAIWQSANWWHHFYDEVEATDSDTTSARRRSADAITGAWCVEHRLGDASA